MSNDEIIKHTMSSFAWHHEFFATLLYNKLKLCIDKDPSVPTLAVSTSELFINSHYFCDGLKEKKYRMAALAHEISHAMFMHPARMQGYLRTGLLGEEFDAERFNIAADLVINALIKECGFTLHPSWYHSPQVSGNDDVVEVYRGLKRRQPQQGQQGQPQQGQGQGQPQQGQPQPQPQQGQGQPQQGQPQQGQPQQGSEWSYKPKDGYAETFQGKTQQDKHVPQSCSKGEELEWKTAVKGAAEAAKSRGNLPGSLKKIVEEIVNPELPWRELLRDYLVPGAGFDSRDHRRFNNYKARELGFLLNKRKSERLDNVAIMIDCSGSVVNEFPVFMGAVLEILEDMAPRSITMLNVDTRVSKYGTFDDADSASKWEVTGGGGTDLPAGFKFMQENGVDTDVCVVLTDGYTPFGKEPDFPVVWVSTGLDVDQYPYGKTLKMG